jgi:hypothetical protein
MQNWSNCSEATEQTFSKKNHYSPAPAMSLKTKSLMSLKSDQTGTVFAPQNNRIFAPQIRRVLHDLLFKQKNLMLNKSDHKSPRKPMNANFS